MKKLLYVIPVLCALIITGCKKEGGDDPKSGITAIEVKPAQTTIAEGANFALTVIPTPKGAKGEYTWVSSDTTVAVVDAEGKVTGITAGTAYITVTEKGGATAKSEIHVTSYLESFSFGQAYFRVTDIDTVNVIERGTTKKYKFWRCDVDVWIMSEGFYLNDSRDLVGAEEALLITLPGHCFYAPEGLNDPDDVGLYCLGEWEIIKDSSEYYNYVGEPGEYGEGVLTNMLSAMDAYNQADRQGFQTYIAAARSAVSGTIMESLYYDCDSTGVECGYYNGNYLIDAILDEGYFYIGTNKGSSGKMHMIDYCKFSFRPLKNNGEEYWWGIAATYDEENYKFTINDRSKLYVGEPITMEFGEMPADAVAARDELVKLPESVILTDQMAANIKAQIKQGNVRTLNTLIRK